MSLPLRELRIKFFYCFYYSLFPISLVVGAIKSDDLEEKIYSFELAIAMIVLSAKLHFIIWKQKEILELLNRICVFSIQNDDDCKFVNKKISEFMKFVILLIILNALLGGFCDSTVAPFVGSEKNLFFKIGFPFDWKNNEVAFWMANLFLFTEVYLSIAACLFPIIMLYLMICCSLRYEVLGNELKNMGSIPKENKRKTSEKEKHDIYLRDLKAAIDSHLHIRGYNYVRSNPMSYFKCKIVTQIDKRAGILFIEFIFRPNCY